MTEKLSKKDKDFYKKLAKLSHKKWEANGRKPRGFSKNPELAKQAAQKSAEVRRKK